MNDVDEHVNVDKDDFVVYENSNNEELSNIKKSNGEGQSNVVVKEKVTSKNCQVILHFQTIHL